jgi:hypothetical protein
MKICLRALLGIDNTLGKEQLSKNFYAKIPDSSRVPTDFKLHVTGPLAARARS